MLNFSKYRNQWIKVGMCARFLVTTFTFESGHVKLLQPIYVPNK